MLLRVPDDDTVASVAQALAHRARHPVLLPAAGHAALVVLEVHVPLLHVLGNVLAFSVREADFWKGDRR